MAQAERTLLDDILNKYLFTILQTDSEGRVVNSAANYASTTKIDAIFRSSVLDKAMVKMTNDIIRQARALHDLNDKYFIDLRSGSRKVFKKTSATIREDILRSIGYSLKGKKIVAKGPLDGLLKDFSVSNQIKGAIQRSIGSEALINDVRKTITKQIVEDGALTRFVKEKLPDPYEAIDRMTGKAFASKLKLRYALYQGGLIRDSRPFCTVRNGNVYTEDEIRAFGTSKDKFGGYTNKSAGEFQGKNKGYDPFRDLGGYNCRHHLDWISEALAFELRPELKNVA